MEGNSSRSEKSSHVESEGWGRWGISPLSVFSGLQKAAAVAAEEISRNAAEVAKSAAQGIADFQSAAPDSESFNEGEEAKNMGGHDVENDGNLREIALDKLEKASEDSLLGQGLKVLDNSMENIASGAWQVLGSAWRGGSNLVQKLESSASNLANSVQHAGLPTTPSLAPSLLETGKTFTAKGLQVLEYVGKETMDLLIAESGIEVEKKAEKSELETDEEQLEDATFDRCFYIYGGPEQLEELESLSSHYTVLFNRRKAQLSSEQKSSYDAKLKQIQQSFCLRPLMQSNNDISKGKNVEDVEDRGAQEIKIMRDSNINKVADMAMGFIATLGGIPGNEIIKRGIHRLEAIHSEGVHRLSELCCHVVSQLLLLGKSVIANASTVNGEEGHIKIDWPEDPLQRANIIKAMAQSMIGHLDAVVDSFVAGIHDVAEACILATKGVPPDANFGLQQGLALTEKANAISDNLRMDQSTAVEKIKDGLLLLAYVIISSSALSAA